jgi:hypothetical protein
MTKIPLALTLRLSNGNSKSINLLIGVFGSYDFFSLSRSYLYFFSTHTSTYPFFSSNKSWQIGLQSMS